MDEAVVEKLRTQLMGLCRDAEAFAGMAQDFPALTCNLARVKASLKMVAIDLGMTTVAARGDC